MLEQVDKVAMVEVEIPLVLLVVVVAAARWAVMQAQIKEVVEVKV